METVELNIRKRESSFANEKDLNRNETKNDEVFNLFNKRFMLVDNESHSLPKLNSIFKYPLWRVPQLQILKQELNNVKNCLNNYDLEKWQTHTRLRNKAKDVIPRLRRTIQPELLTQAWCKFHEIVSSYPLVPVDYIYKNKKVFKSVHLCEAPGAFVTSLNHWLKSNVPDIQWDWTATTLNPYYEGNSVNTMIDDDRFIRYTLNHWSFGKDSTGNIMNLNNLNDLIKETEPHDNIFLVTADGSVDCADVPGEQESVLTHLHFCETLAALHLLAAGGSFLLKIFTIFECNTICLLYLLSCCFTNVSIIKPATSKEGNSEVYVVCINFKKRISMTTYLEKLKECYEHGPKNAIFNQDDIPENFVKRIIKCSAFFKTQQCTVIENNIQTFNIDYAYMMQDLRQIQSSVADKYIKDYKVRKLVAGQIVGNAVMLKTPTNFNLCKTPMPGSYTERCEKQHLPSLDRIESFCKDIENIDMYLSPNHISKSKFTEVPEELRIRTGKVFRKIRSSKFCNKFALKILNGTNDVLAQMNKDFKIQFPSIMSIQKLRTEIDANHKLLVFLFTNVHDSHRLITRIYNALMDLDNGKTLILIGYSLLTHLNIELLYLIGCAFESVQIMVHFDVGLIITLDHYNNSNSKIREHLEKLNVASQEAYQQGIAILEIFHPLILYEGCTLCHSSDYNLWIIRVYICYVIRALKEENCN